jgi:hypothetical protein
VPLWFVSNVGLQIILRRLTFGGYNDKLQKFASYISKKISADMKDILPRDEAEFERYKDILTRSFAVGLHTMSDTQNLVSTTDLWAHCVANASFLFDERPLM